MKLNLTAKSKQRFNTGLRFKHWEYILTMGISV